MLMYFGMGRLSCAINQLVVINPSLGPLAEKFWKVSLQVWGQGARTIYQLHE